MAPISQIAVIGAGTMGQGIAQLCALSDFTVLLYDVQPELGKSALINISRSMDVAVQKGKITPFQKDHALKQIIFVDDFRQLQVDLVIEAIIEKLEVKQKILSEVEKLNSRHCIIASNTSSISITQIAAALRHPERFAGLHFFNPATTMKLVEIITGTSTSKPTIEALAEFSQRIGKTHVLAADSPGFIVNRVARHFYTESLKLSEDGACNFEGIDKLVRASGFRMGPFELMDLIGIDINYAVTETIYAGFHQVPKFRPSRTQQQKVASGQLGRKTGKGFYHYPDLPKK
jgi:3-hydroxybutyryl-CoA dehydrogenase